MKIQLLAFIAKLLRIQFKIDGLPYGADKKNGWGIPVGKFESSTLSSPPPDCETEIWTNDPFNGGIYKIKI